MLPMNTPQDSSLGREVEYPRQYDASLLFPIPRSGARSEIGLAGDALPFVGEDRWHAYEVGWLDARGKPCVETVTLWVPATSPNLIESKSLKLYLNSLNSARFNRAEAVRERIATDLSACAGADVRVEFGLPMFAEAPGQTIDHLDVDIDCYGPPNAAFLSADADEIVSETLTSALLKSNCPVTGQPDWASVSIRYQGPRIDREGLLRYLVSYRDHAEFHEQCVERIFLEVSRRCTPTLLDVEARYTRRGGLDINPRRVTPGVEGGYRPFRELRQ